MKELVIVWHSQFGATAQMAAAARDGAQGIGAAKVTYLHAREADASHLLRCDALLLVTSENFGSLSGLVKDFLERVYYPCQQRVEGKAYSVIVCAGSDGTGAMLQTDRIAKGLALRKVHPGIVHRTGVTAQPSVIADTALAQCRELGALLAAGVDAGVF